MRKIYATLVFVLMLGGNSIVSAQCDCEGTDYGTLNVAGWIVGQSQDIATNIYAGERSTILNTVAGAVYRVSTCGASYDTQLSIYTTGCVYVAFNDDFGPACGGAAASVDFTSPGGNIYSKLNQYNCATNLTNTTVTVTLISLPSANTVPFTGNNSYTLCSGNLYDHGGPSGNYDNNANGFTVLNPSTPSNLIQLSGTTAGEGCCDFLTIFDGVGTGGTILWTGVAGAGVVPVVTSTTGPLTVQFTSDNSVTGVGFDLSINCVPDPNILLVPFSGNNSFTVCSGNLYDHGGPSGDYDHGANGFTVLNPSTPGNGIQLSGTTAGEGCCDFLTIFDGVGTGGTILWTGVAGEGVVPVVTSTTGPLTVQFTSDNSVSGDGFNLSINCVPICEPSLAPTSISGITNICVGGSTTLTAVGGNLEPGGTIEWFTSSCGGTAAGTGPSITVSPASTSEYFVRYTGPCGTSTCAATNVVVSSGFEITATNNGNLTLTASSSASYQWVTCPGYTPIAGETFPTIVISENGSYAVIGTDANGCVDTSACITIANVSIEDYVTNDVLIYPNPSTDFVIIEFNSAAAQIEILDTRGKLIQTAHINSGEQISLKNEPSGVYFIRISTENASSVHRIVKQ